MLNRLESVGGAACLATCLFCQEGCQYDSPSKVRRPPLGAVHAELGHNGEDEALRADGTQPGAVPECAAPREQMSYIEVAVEPSSQGCVVVCWVQTPAAANTFPRMYGSRHRVPRAAALKLSDA